MIDLPRADGVVLDSEKFTLVTLVKHYGKSKLIYDFEGSNPFSTVEKPYLCGVFFFGMIFLFSGIHLLVYLLKLNYYSGFINAIIN